MSKYIIGINGSFHDASVCVLDINMNEPYLMLSEDRHSGFTHHYGFPFESMSIALDKIGTNEIIGVGYSRNKSFFETPPEYYFNDILESSESDIANKFISQLLTGITHDSSEFNKVPVRVNDFISNLTSCNDELALKKRVAYLIVKYKNELITEKNIRKFLPDVSITGFTHHDTHAATFYTSPYDEATIITWDGRGEFDSTVLYHGKENLVERISAIKFPLSLGNFYEIFSEYIGLGRIEGPGKLMGLAAYGDDRFVNLFNELITVDNEEFNFDFNTEYLVFSQNDRLSVTESFKKHIGAQRKENEPLNDTHKAIAYAVQNTIEHVCVKLVSNGMKITGSRNLVLSGGLSLNCVMNEKVREKLNVDPFLIPPCGDDGTALGAALLALKQCTEKMSKSKRVQYKSTYGTSNESKEVKEYLEENQLIYTKYKPEEVAELLAQGKFIGYMQGRYEFGPRALGFRSILADPRQHESWPYINSEIKYREDFRPFAPVMMMEDAQKYWGKKSKPTHSPYMLLAPCMSSNAKDDLSAVIHCDLSARVQTLNKEFNPELYKVIEAFKMKTGVGTLLNTSLNMSGESIIISYLGLIHFMAFSNLDAIVVNELLIEKENNEKNLKKSINGISTRQDYLVCRKREYERKWRDEISSGVYIGYEELFEYLYN